MSINQNPRKTQSTDNSLTWFDWQTGSPLWHHCQVTKTRHRFELVDLMLPWSFFFQRQIKDFNDDHMILSSGVGAMTWSPLACGIISGKYDGRVPPYSRASLKVDAHLARFCSPTLIIMCHCSVFPYWSQVVCLFIVCLCLSGAHLISVCFQCRVDAMYCVPLPKQRCLPAGVSLTHFSIWAHTIHVHQNVYTQNRSGAACVHIYSDLLVFNLTLLIPRLLNQN